MSLAGLGEKHEIKVDEILEDEKLQADNNFVQVSVLVSGAVQITWTLWTRAGTRVQTKMLFLLTMVMPPHPHRAALTGTEMF